MEEMRQGPPTENRTLHRSSRVLRGDPSSAVFRASTGFDLPAPHSINRKQWRNQEGRESDRGLTA